MWHSFPVSWPSTTPASHHGHSTRATPQCSSSLATSQRCRAARSSGAAGSRPTPGRVQGVSAPHTPDALQMRPAGLQALPATQLTTTAPPPPPPAPANAAASHHAGRGAASGAGQRVARGSGAAHRAASTTNAAGVFERVVVADISTWLAGRTAKEAPSANAAQGDAKVSGAAQAANKAFVKGLRSVDSLDQLQVHVSQAVHQLDQQAVTALASALVSLAKGTNSRGTSSTSAATVSTPSSTPLAAAFASAGSGQHQQQQQQVHQHTPITLASAQPSSSTRRSQPQQHQPSSPSLQQQHQQSHTLQRPHQQQQLAPPPVDHHHQHHHDHQQQQQQSPNEQSRQRPRSAGVQEFLLRTWQPLLLNVLPRMDMAGVCISMHALASLHVADARLMEPLLVASEPQLPRSSPRVQAQMLWVQAKLGIPPPQPWMRAWTQASLRSLPRYSPQDLAMTLWSLAKLKAGVPSEAWSRAALRAVAGQLSHFGPQALGVTMWALTSLRVTPPPELVDAVLERAIDLMADDAATQSQTASAASPAETGSSSIGSTALAMLAYSLMILQHKPSRDFMSHFLAATQSAMPHSSPQELSLFSLAVTNWQLRPPPAWLSTLVGTSGPRLHFFSAQGLTFLGDALAQIGYRPPGWWMAAYERCVWAQLPRFPPNAAAQVLCAFGALGYCPRPVLGKALLGRVVRGADHVRAKRWFPALLSAALLGLLQPSGPSEASGGGKTVIASEAQLLPSSSQTPSSSTIAAAPPAGGGKASQQQTRQGRPLAATSAATARQSGSAGLLPPSDRSELQPPRIPQSPTNSSDSSSQGPKAAAPEYLIEDLVVISQSKYAHCRARNLSHLAWALTLLSLEKCDPSFGLTLPPGWLHSLMAAVRQKLGLASPHDVTTLLAGLALLLGRHTHTEHHTSGHTHSHTGHHTFSHTGHHTSNALQQEQGLQVDGSQQDGPSSVEQQYQHVVPVTIQQASSQPDTLSGSAPVTSKPQLPSKPTSRTQTDHWQGGLREDQLHTLLEAVAAAVQLYSLEQLLEALSSTLVLGAREACQEGSVSAHHPSLPVLGTSFSSQSTAVGVGAPVHGGVTKGAGSRGGAAKSDLSSTSHIQPPTSTSGAQQTRDPERGIKASAGAKSTAQGDAQISPVAKLVWVLCERALQLLVSLQPPPPSRQPQELHQQHYRGTCPTNGTSAVEGDGLNAPPQYGMSAALLQHAAAHARMLQHQHPHSGLAHSHSLAGLVEEPVVIQAWRVLLQCSYFVAPVQSRAKQVQVCMAMYRLVQTHVLADPDLSRQWGARCAELAAQMPCHPPEDWEALVQPQEVEQVEQLETVGALA